MNADGTAPGPLLPASALAGSQHDLVGSPRGRRTGPMIAFNCAAPTTRDVSHICVVNADGTDIRPLTDESAAWVETDLAWSPDSTRIAFNRWHTDPATRDDHHPTDRRGVRQRRSRHRHRADAGLRRRPLQWSPDGTTLLSLPGTCCRRHHRERARSDLSRSTSRPATRARSTGAWAAEAWQRVAGRLTAAPTAPLPDKEEPRVVGPGVQVNAVLVAGRGFEPLTFGL